MDMDNVIFASPDVWGVPTYANEPAMLEHIAGLEDVGMFVSIDEADILRLVGTEDGYPVYTDGVNYAKFAPSPDGNYAIVGEWWQE